MRRGVVAELAGVSPEAVRQVSIAEVRHMLVDVVPSVVLDVLDTESTTFWLAGGHYWFDDPIFGDVVAVENLSYDSELGLYSRHTFPDRG